MAYADKITTMRRIALIHEGGNIEWEGVDIEGKILLKKVECLACTTLVLSVIELDDFAEQEELKVKYLDKVKKQWEPRKSRDFNYWF